MQLTGHITRESLMSLEAYSQWRTENRRALVAHRELRSVRLGEHLNLQFESETTIRYQIQEMLRIEKNLRSARHPARDRRLRPLGSQRAQLDGHAAHRIHRSP